MTDTKSASAAEQAENAKADHDKSFADGQVAGAKAAQERIAAIVALDAAKDRPKQANHIAFKTTMSVDEAKAMLEASAPEDNGKKPLSIADRANAGAGMDPQTALPPPKLRVDIVADMARRHGIN